MVDLRFHFSWKTLDERVCVHGTALQLDQLGSDSSVCRGREVTGAPGGSCCRRSMWRALAAAAWGSPTTASK